MTKMMKALIIMSLTLPLMAAKCSPGGYITCPTLKQYSQSFLSKAADEIEMIEKDAPNVTQMINDYGVERDAIRKCIKLRAKSHT